MLKNALTKMGLIEETVEVPKTKAPTTAQAAQVQTQAVAPAIKNDPAVEEMLRNSLNESKLSGFDYLKYMSAVQEMAGFNTPEDTRFRMAFMAAKQLGVDKDGLVKSAQHYLDVLNQDKAEFDSGCASFEKKEIQGRESKMSELSAKMQALSAEMDSVKEEYQKLAEELSSKKESLETRKASFQTTLQTFVGEIENNVSKITKYL